MRGRDTMAMLGYYPSNMRSVPTGYMLQLVPVTINGKATSGQRLELDPDTAPLVRRAYDLRLAGATYSEIRAAVPVLATDAHLYNLFRQRAYCGHASWHGIEIPCPAIVTETEWQTAYDGLAWHRGGAYSKRKRSAYLLSGLVRCGECGKPMVGHAQHNRPHRFYYCKTRDCPVRTIRTEALDAMVIAYVMDELLTTRHLERMRQAQAHNPDGERLARVEELGRELARVERALANLTAALETVEDNREVLARMRQRGDERRRLQAELAALAGRRSELPTLEDIAGLREDLQASLSQNVRDSRDLLARVLTAVVVFAADEVQVVPRWAS
jgi:hypothetical protein